MPLFSLIMGASASKSAKSAGSAVRKYPTRAPANTTIAAAAATATRAAAAPTQRVTPGPSFHPPVEAAETKTEAIEQDARDPALAARLNSLGAVQPNPYYSPTSTSQFDPRRMPSDAMMQEPPRSAFPDPRNNPVLKVLEARRRIADEAEDEIRHVGRRSFQGLTYLDAGLIQLALMRRAKGEPDARIEEALGIKKGRLSVLSRGIVAPVQE